MRFIILLYSTIIIFTLVCKSKLCESCLDLTTDSTQFLVADYEYAIHFAVSHQVISQFQFKMKNILKFSLFFAIFTNFDFLKFASHLIIDSTQVGVADHKYAICFVALPQVISQSEFEMKKFLKVLLAYAIFINFNLLKFISDLITDST